MNNYLITPNSDIYLLKCPIESDSLNQIDFANATAQHNYFNGLPKILMDDATYVRKDGRLYFEGSFDSLVGYNYCMYKNTGFSNKWFYAFISDMRYESNNSVSVDIQTDVFQTWMFEKVMKRSFIERSHVAKSTDTLGTYTLPENLETGEYKCMGEYKGDSDTLWNLEIIVGSTYNLESGGTWSVGNMYTGVYSGIPYYRFPLTSDATLSQKIVDMGQEVAQSAIQTMFLAPAWVVEVEGSTCYVKRGLAAKITDIKVPVVNTIDGYTPKNKKVLQFPYCYLDGSNGNGGNAIYHVEKFYNTDYNGYYTFRCYGVLVPGCSIRMIPKYYNGLEVNNDEGITLGKYPQLGWSTDQYTNWLTQNGVNIGISTAGALAKTALGVGAMALAPELLLLGGGMAVSGLSEIGQTASEIYQHSLVPPQSEGNLNSGDVTSTIGYNRFRIKRMTIRQEYARIIDNYFEMFGYKLNTVAVPNTTSRSKWNYIKTINVNITGDIPEQDMQKLKALYNSGFTIWHDTNHYLDYSQTNA